MIFAFCSFVKSFINKKPRGMINNGSSLDKAVSELARSIDQRHDNAIRMYNAIGGKIVGWAKKFTFLKPISTVTKKSPNAILFKA
jgi:hypothetical protein